MNFSRILRIVLGVYIIGWGIYEQTYIGLLGLLPLISGILNTCPGNSCDIK